MPPLSASPRPKISFEYSLQLTIDIEGIVSSDFHLSDLLTGESSIGQRWIKLVAPRGPVWISITVVITEEIVPSSLFATLNLKRLIDGRKELFGKVGNQIYQCVDIVGRVFRVKTAEEIAMVVVSKLWFNYRTLVITYRAESNGSGEDIELVFEKQRVE